MTTYITQEQAAALAKASGFTVHRGLGLLQSVPEDVFGHGLISKEIHALCNAAVQHYRDSLLVAGGVLPEPELLQICTGNGDWVDADNESEFDIYAEADRRALYTAVQLRQAIADALAKQQDHLQDIAAFIGVGGYNGATTEQLVERIKGEFQRLGRLLNDALAKQVPPEKCSLCGAPIGEECFLQNSSQSNCKMAKQVPQGYKLVPETPTNDMTVAMANALEDPENERSSWDLAENMYAAMLAAVPAQQVPQWLPIEIAPKDGTQIVIPSQWSGQDADIASFDTHEGAWFSVKLELLIDQPDCWMPIPAAPAPKEQQ